MTKEYETILLAAGSSKRLNEKRGTNKILKPLDGRPVFDYSLRLFLEDARCQTIWFVVKEQEKEEISHKLKDSYKEIPQKIKWVSGGKERQDSVQKALEEMDDEMNYVMIHDAARPFVNKELIDSLMIEVYQSEAVSVGIPATDSMKIVKQSFVDHSLYRPSVWHIQTPQVFSKELIKKAMRKAASEQFYGNEEGELVERLGHSVKIIEGYKQNFKITTPFDYQMAQLVARNYKQKK